MKLSTFRTAAIATLAIASQAAAWYLPGSAPHSYKAGDDVPFSVNALQAKAFTSQIKGVLKYDYYDPHFKFCQPAGGPQAQSENLGSVLFGDRIYSSPVKGVMLKDEICKEICRTSISSDNAAFINDRIREEYAVNWMVDGLPVAESRREVKTREEFLSLGFALGSLEDEHFRPYDPPALHNHYDIYIDYHKRGPDEYRVVGARIYPLSKESLKGVASSQAANCNAADPIQLSNLTTTPLAYTYSIRWRESQTPWATRWDAYLKVFDPRIHWLALINSVVIVSFLCIMVGIVVARSISRDIHRYNAIDMTEDVQEDFGWKLLHAEVFRPPNRPMLLSIFVGSGSQLVAMAAVTLIFALLGFLSPSNRGSLATVMIVTWTLFGSIAGFMSSKMYASLGGEFWKQNILLTAMLFPSLVFSMVLLLNFFLIFSGSSGAVPFGTLLALVALWMLINVPLTCIGALLAIRSGGFIHPVKANSIPRQIPYQHTWYLRPFPSALIAGMLIFASAFLEILFILNSMFGTKIYYAFGFLALAFIITATTAATVTILFAYFHLCAEDYRWQWRAFMTGGSGAIWFVAYGLFFWATRLELPGLANKMLFLGYLSILSLLFFTLFGAIGFLATYAALRKIYSAIRVD
ncbi:related to endosomal protein EMP70 precursor [Melanopsichium pennsylvanicum]|uniref:Transmembrane 9 superfamily member n=2 Tax=Melanopsichium pennsylvanicum TaxID=63383 RepID=A0AAJ4XM45_9BASI|nr:related to endosomal protein EMP70 precursor [Melanopsichium pennsylvanicum 4]SNX84730.1 related to endosomal protein EMP70 precursor [Melanopsichium pennsylvanicum]